MGAEVPPALKGGDSDPVSQGPQGRKWGGPGGCSVTLFRGEAELRECFGGTSRELTPPLPLPQGATLTQKVTAGETLEDHPV